MDRLLTGARLRVEKDKVVHIERRLLNNRCNIEFEVGAEVCPEDTLCAGPLTSGYWVIHLSKELSVEPKQAFGLLKRKIGQSICQGELLASKEAKFGFGKKLLLSPVDGIIELYDDKDGILKIKISAKMQKIPSGVYGIIDAVDHASQSVIIRTQATVIHGILGFGKTRAGMLKVLGKPSDIICSRQITDDLEGKILVGGATIIVDALSRAEKLGVEGIILGGVDIGDFKAMTEGLGLVGLLITEGLGSISIGDDIFNILKEHNNRFAILEGTFKRLILPSHDPDSIIKVKSTVLPSKDVRLEVTEGITDLKVGARVRIISDPFLGLQGIVESIDQSATKLPSGIESTLVTIATPSRKIREPYQNLEII